MRWIREMFWVCVIYNIHLVSQHIRTDVNRVPDYLSHIFDPRRTGTIPSGSLYGLCCCRDGKIEGEVYDYQSAWMADSTAVTRKSQWKCYFRFCSEYELEPLPASLDTVLLYIVFLADRLKYVSIINYLSALWVLHRINGIPHGSLSRNVLH